MSQGERERERERESAGRNIVIPHSVTTLLVSYYVIHEQAARSLFTECYYLFTNSR